MAKSAILAGSRDPLVNPLPTMFWTVWWVGFTLLHALFGNLWAWFNPWYAPLRLLGWLSRGRIGRAAILPLPRTLGYFPSILIFGAFAWFELISLAPSDPTRLAEIVGLYWLFVLTAMIVFSEKTWAATAEPFSIYFSLIAGLAPLKLEALSAERPEPRRLCIVWPGSSLIARNGMPVTEGCLAPYRVASVTAKLAAGERFEPSRHSM